MNDPFEFLRRQELKTEKEARRLKLRTQVLMAIFCGMLAAFFAVLFRLQIVEGESWLPVHIHRTTTERERVDSVRGEILDRYGRLLVTNTMSYHVELKMGDMGERRNEIIAGLLELCREEGVEWAEAMPISKTAPWTYTDEEPLCYDTEDENGDPVAKPTALGRLAQERGWVKDAVKEAPDAETLFTAMCLDFGLIEKGEAPDASDREVAGVLYALYLRAEQVYYTDYIFADDVDIAFISKAKERGLDGVVFRTDTARRTLTGYAAHVLGTVGAIQDGEQDYYTGLGYPLDATVGRSGVELAFEEWLHGTSGTRLIVKGEDGTVEGESWEDDQPPVAGSSVSLTLDMTLQTVTENLLSQFESGLEEEGGAAAVVLDMTGGVLAMASYPQFSESQLNRATQGLYAPGSTFKMVTATAGLTEGVITPRDTVICTGLYRYYTSPQPACWINPGSHGSENVSEAITDSCNIFFYDVGRRTGIAKLAEYAAKFGLGQLTGIEIDEKRGQVAGPETSEALGQTWYDGDTLSASIGQQNNLFTPIQLANYVATLVNGGTRYQAHLLKEVRAADNSGTLYEYRPQALSTIDIAPEHLAAIKKGMYDLAKTASMNRYFGSLPVEVGCKTGTAEVGKSTANAVFVCFAPFDDPQVAICLVAEKGASGGNLAQIAAGILQQYFSTGSSLDSAVPENTLIR